MPAKVSKTPKDAPRQFKSSLARNTIIIILILALLPVVAIGGATLLQIQQLLKTQTGGQFQTVAQNFVAQLESMTAARQSLLGDIKSDDVFVENLNILMDPASDEYARFEAKTAVSTTVSKIAFSPTVERLIDGLAIFQPDGSLLFATRESWESNTEALDPAVRRLLGTNDSALVYDVPPFYPNQFVLISAKVFVSNDIDQIVTMMSFSLPKDPQELLNTAKIYFPNAIGYYYTADKTLVYIDETGKLAEIGLTESQIDDMQTLQSLSSQKKIQETTGLDAQPAYAYVQPVGGLKTSLVLEMPRKILDAQIQSLARVNLLLIGISVLIIGALVYLGTTSIVRPLVRLANNAKSFAGGDWSERARVNRNDEIGLLANSFNEMVEQLSVLYRSMELKVEERTSQLRTASEVAQVATSVTSQTEMAEKAASLIKDRFGYYYVAVYLMDATASYAILRSVACDDAEFRDLVGYRIPVNSQTMIGWVASHGQSQVSLDISPTEAIEQGRNIMPLSRSAMAVPIVVGNQVLGIVEVQSTKPNDFDPDAISVFQTMADQIATGFRNVSLLESAQVNLDEVGLLYRSSRQIAQAKDEREVLENLSEALSHSQYVSIVLEAAEDHLVIRSIHDPKGTGFDSTLRGVALPVRQGLGRLSETPILLIDDLRTSSEFENLLTFLARRECRTAALIPVLMDGKPNKVIAIGSREGTALSANVLQPYSSIAEVAGSTLGRLNLVRSLSARLSDIESIADFSQAISTETDLSRLYKVLHDQAIKTFGGDIFFLVALFDSKHDMIEVPYFYQGDRFVQMEPYPVGDGLVSHIIRTKQPLMLVKNIEQTMVQMRAIHAGGVAKSWLGVPLIVGGDLVGVLSVQDIVNEERFDEGDLNLLLTLAPQIANAIRNAQLLKQTQDNLQAYEAERALLNILLANTPEQIYIKNTAGEYQRVSQSFADWVGISRPDDIAGKTDADLFGTEFGEKVFEEERTLLSSGINRIGEIEQTKDKAGNLFWGTHSRILISDSAGLTTGILGIRQDITEIKIAEQLSMRRADQLQTIADIAREATGTLDVNELLKKAVNLIRDRFGFYHSSIFLIDPNGEYAELRESTGEAGAKMMAAGHRLVVGSASMVGQSTRRGEPVVSNDVTAEPNYYPNPMLPETRSELAIPLRSGGRILGALDVQSTQTQAFSPEDIDTLQLLADQIAIAVTNSNLFARSQDALIRQRLVNEITVTAAAAQSLDEAIATAVKGLREAMGGDRISVFLVDEGQRQMHLHTSAGYGEGEMETLIVPFGEGIVGEAAETAETIRVDDAQNDPRFIAMEEDIRSELAIPIHFTDQLIGVLNLESKRLAAYDESDEQILEALGNNLGAVISNAQLLRQIRMQVERQQQLYEITSKIRRSSDLQTILRTSATEIARALGAERAEVRLSTRTIGRAADEPTADNGHEPEIEK